MHLFNPVRYAPRALTLILALGALAVVGLALLLSSRWGVNACYLCVFQRLLFLILAAALLVASAGWRGRGLPRLALALAALVALGGMAVAGYQSGLQWLPSLELSCGAGQQNLIERIVEWLTPWSPTLFMANGFCEDDDFRLLGLSFANASFLAYGAYLAVSLALLRRHGHRLDA